MFLAIDMGVIERPISSGRPDRSGFGTPSAEDLAEAVDVLAQHCLALCVVEADPAVLRTPAVYLGHDHARAVVYLFYAEAEYLSLAQPRGRPHEEEGLHLEARQRVVERHHLLALPEGLGGELLGRVAELC